MSYYELWAIMNNWKKEFSTFEFATTFPGPDPRKVLSDMAKKGLLEHLSYGRYRVRPIEDYVRTKNDVNEAYDILNKSKLPYALTEVDGVFAWTKGGYNVGRFFGYYPIHLNVLENDVTKWKKFFRKNGKKVYRYDEIPKETIFGIFYLIHPKKRIESRKVEGLSVVPLEETLTFAKNDTYAYDPALEMLDAEYKLGLGSKYSA